MSAGQDRYRARLARGIKKRQTAPLYVKRRTAKRGTNRVLVTLPAPVRYALCVWGSYRATLRAQAVSQELQRIIWEGLRRRLGPEAEAILVECYEAYAKGCADRGEVNIFEAVAADA